MEEHILRRLLYSKALLLHGSKHAEENTSIDAVLAILHFDNSTEMLMNTILEYFGAPYKRERYFHELIEAVITVVKKENNAINADKLLKVIELKNLHNARNTIQHNGIIPALDEVRRYRILTHNIVEGVMFELFDLPFRDVSLGSLIKDKEIRDLYIDADNAYQETKYKKTIIRCIVAFESAKKKEQVRIYGSGILMGKYMITGKIPENVEKYLDIIIEELEILKLRLDYKKYQKYRDLCPDLRPLFNISQNDAISKIEEIVNKRITILATALDTAVLKECARFYLDFAIDSILRWESVSRAGWNPIIQRLESID